MAENATTRLADDEIRAGFQLTAQPGGRALPDRSTFATRGVPGPCLPILVFRVDLSEELARSIEPTRGTAV